MKSNALDRKEFLATLGRFGAGGCLCAAAAGMQAAFAGQTSPQKPAQPAAPAAPPEGTKPGQKTVERYLPYHLAIGDLELKRAVSGPVRH